jgi:NAD(P)-dependent dehydrogenase (short-subunit alcohol dehydrogenase family)
VKYYRTSKFNKPRRLIMAIDLTGSRVLVVGAGGGIGAATAGAFAQAGAEVFANGRPGAELDAVAAEVHGVALALDFLDNPGPGIFRKPTRRGFSVRSSGAVGRRPRLRAINRSSGRFQDFAATRRIAAGVRDRKSGVSL